MRLTVMLLLAIAAGSVGIDAQKPASDKVTVDRQVLDNYFDRDKTGIPIPSRGPIELQTHNSEMRFRNIHIRAIPAGTQ